MLYLIEGSYGSGKTLLATRIAKYYPGLVLSNYPLLLPNYRELSLPDVPNIEEQALIILDEAYKYIRSRLSGSSAINNAMSDLLFQSRKISKDFVLTEQLNRTIDVNFRELADYIVQAYHLDEFRPTERFRYEVYDGHTGDRLGVYDMSLHWAKTYLYPLYDTLYKIETNKDMGKELILVEPKDMEKELSKILPELEEEIPLKAWTKPMIKDYCAQKLYPSKFADTIFARVKREVIRETYKS
ncbi:MAG: hypothetical protein PHT07_23890 [Paludibacter sp.]|nr:hypothetical protein [Paludibacter sp.]